jgi:hypothetical protein
VFPVWQHLLWSGADADADDEAEAKHEDEDEDEDEEDSKSEDEVVENGAIPTESTLVPASSTSASSSDDAGANADGGGADADAVAVAGDTNVDNGAAAPGPVLLPSVMRFRGLCSGALGEGMNLRAAYEYFNDHVVPPSQRNFTLKSHYLEEELTTANTLRGELLPSVPVTELANHVATPASVAQIHVGHILRGNLSHFVRMVRTEESVTVLCRNPSTSLFEGVVVTSDGVHFRVDDRGMAVYGLVDTDTFVPRHPLDHQMARFSERLGVRRDVGTNQNQCALVVLLSSLLTLDIITSEMPPVLHV